MATNDPNFAIICAFFDRFADILAVDKLSNEELRLMLEDSEEVPNKLKELHIKLLRKARKSVQPDRWEKALIKFCQAYSFADSWEIERFGYKKANITVKLRVLKTLLESQFDANLKFKNTINLLTAPDLRSEPIGKDDKGNVYWSTLDENCNLKIFRENVDDEKWKIVASNREELVNLIERLKGNEPIGCSSDDLIDEDSSSNSMTVKSDSKASADQKVIDNTSKIIEEEKGIYKSVITSKPSEKSDDPTKSSDSKPGISLILSRRSYKKTESNHSNASNNDDIEEGEEDDFAKRLRDNEDYIKSNQNTKRPKLLQNHKKHVEDEEDYDDEEDFDEEEADDEEEEDDDDYGDEIAEPTLYVKGEGSGNDCKGSPFQLTSDNVELSDTIDEEIMYIFGEGGGSECLIGNPGKSTNDAPKEAEKSSEVDSSPTTSTVVPKQLFFFGRPGCLQNSPTKTPSMTPSFGAITSPIAIGSAKSSESDVEKPKTLKLVNYDTDSNSGSSNMSEPETDVTDKKVISNVPGLTPANEENNSIITATAGKVTDLSEILTDENDKEIISIVVDETISSEGTNLITVPETTALSTSDDVLKSKAMQTELNEVSHDESNIAKPSEIDVELKSPDKSILELDPEEKASKQIIDIDTTEKKILEKILPVCTGIDSVVKRIPVEEDAEIHDIVVAENLTVEESITTDISEIAAENLPVGGSNIVEVVSVENSPVGEIKIINTDAVENQSVELPDKVATANLSVVESVSTNIDAADGLPIEENKTDKVEVENRPIEEIETIDIEAATENLLVIESNASEITTAENFILEKSKTINEDSTENQPVELRKLTDEVVVENLSVDESERSDLATTEKLSIEDSEITDAKDVADNLAIEESKAIDIATSENQSTEESKTSDIAANVTAEEDRSRIEPENLFDEGSSLEKVVNESENIIQNMDESVAVISEKDCVESQPEKSLSENMYSQNHSIETLNVIEVAQVSVEENKTQDISICHDKEIITESFDETPNIDEITTSKVCDDKSSEITELADISTSCTLISTGIPEDTKAIENEVESIDEVVYEQLDNAVSDPIETLDTAPMPLIPESTQLQSTERNDESQGYELCSKISNSTVDPQYISGNDKTIPVDSNILNETDNHEFSESMSETKTETVSSITDNLEISQQDEKNDSKENDFTIKDSGETSSEKMPNRSIDKTVTISDSVCEKSIVPISENVSLQKTEPNNEVLESSKLGLQNENKNTEKDTTDNDVISPSVQSIATLRNNPSIIGEKNETPKMPSRKSDFNENSSDYLDSLSDDMEFDNDKSQMEDILSDEGVDDFDDQVNNNQLKPQSSSNTDVGKATSVTSDTKSHFNMAVIIPQILNTNSIVEEKADNVDEISEVQTSSENLDKNNTEDKKPVLVPLYERAESSNANIIKIEDSHVIKLEADLVESESIVFDNETPLAPRNAIVSYRDVGDDIETHSVIHSFSDYFVDYEERMDEVPGSIIRPRVGQYIQTSSNTLIPDRISTDVKPSPWRSTVLQHIIDNREFDDSETKREVTQSVLDSKIFERVAAPIENYESNSVDSIPDDTKIGLVSTNSGPSTISNSLSIFSTKQKTVIAEEKLHNIEEKKTYIDEEKLAPENIKESATNEPSLQPSVDTTQEENLLNAEKINVITKVEVVKNVTMSDDDDPPEEFENPPKILNTIKHTFQSESIKQFDKIVVTHAELSETISSGISEFSRPVNIVQSDPQLQLASNKDMYSIQYQNEQQFSADLSSKQIKTEIESNVKLTEQLPEMSTEDKIIPNSTGPNENYSSESYFDLTNKNQQISVAEISKVDTPNICVVDIRQNIIPQQSFRESYVQNKLEDEFSENKEKQQNIVDFSLSKQNYVAQCSTTGKSEPDELRNEQKSIANSTVYDQERVATNQLFRENLAKSSEFSYYHPSVPVIQNIPVQYATDMSYMPPDSDPSCLSEVLTLERKKEFSNIESTDKHEHIDSSESTTYITLDSTPASNWVKPNTEINELENANLGNTSLQTEADIFSNTRPQTIISEATNVVKQIPSDFSVVSRFVSSSEIKIESDTVITKQAEIPVVEDPTSGMKKDTVKSEAPVITKLDNVLKPPVSVNRKRRLSEPKIKSSESESDQHYDDNVEPLMNDDTSEEEDVGGKRIKMRSKHVDTNFRKEIEAKKIEENLSSSGSDEDDVKKRPKISPKRKKAQKDIIQAEVQPPVSEKKKKDNETVEISTPEPQIKTPSRGKKTPLKKTSPKDSNAAKSGSKYTAESETPVRQSRRIAQQKIREETERRQMEEKLLKQMKADSEKKKLQGESANSNSYKEFSTDAEADADEENSKDTEKRKKKKKKKDRPWQTDSSDSSSDTEQEEEIEEHEPSDDERHRIIKSDHEFSPESDVEDDQAVPTKRARTLKKDTTVDNDEEEEDYNPNHACQKCRKTDHPEWILLCDNCDHGYHCSCLKPVLFIIPEGDWFCPVCQQQKLIENLTKHLQDYDAMVKKFEIAENRRKRLAYVEVSVDNVLTSNQDKRKTRSRSRSVKARSPIGANGSESSSTDSNSDASDSDDEPIYKLRKRNQTNVSYRFNEYDDLINSAIRDEMDEVQGAGNLGRGKDIATIIEADREENKIILPPMENKDDETNNESKLIVNDAEVIDFEDKIPLKVKPIAGKEMFDSDSDSEPIRRPTKKSGKKKKKLNNLDVSSDEDGGSDEDFKESSLESDESENYSASSASESSLDYPKKKNKGGSGRRTTRASNRQKRFDTEFIDDDDSDYSDAKIAPRKKKKKPDSDEYEMDDDDDDDDEEEEDLDSEDLCDDTDTDSSNSDWRSKRKKKSSGGSSKKKRPEVRTPVIKKKKVARVDENDRSFRAGISAKKIRKEESEIDEDASQSSKSQKRTTRGRKMHYIEDYESSDDGGITPGVKRPDTPPEERELFIKKQEEIKRMLAAKDAEVASKIGTSFGSAEEDEPAVLDSISTVPLQVIEGAKALDADFLKSKHADSEDFDANFPEDFDPEDMDDDDLAKMMEEEDFAQQQLKLAGEAIARKKLKDQETKKHEKDIPAAKAKTTPPPKPTKVATGEPKKRGGSKKKVDTIVAPVAEVPVLLEQPPIQSPLQSPLQSSLQPSVQTPLQSTLQSPLQSTLQSPLQSTIQSPLQSTLQSPLQSLTQSMSLHQPHLMTNAQYSPQLPNIIQSPYNALSQMPLSLPPMPQEPIIPTTVLAVQSPQPNSMELSGSEYDNSPVKKRGRRKKFTPLREDLAKSGPILSASPESKLPDVNKLPPGASAPQMFTSTSTPGIGVPSSVITRLLQPQRPPPMSFGGSDLSSQSRFFNASQIKSPLGAPPLHGRSPYGDPQSAHLGPPSTTIPHMPSAPPHFLHSNPGVGRPPLGVHPMYRPPPSTLYRGPPPISSRLPYHVPSTIHHSMQLNPSTNPRQLGGPRGPTHPGQFGPGQFSVYYPHLQQGPPPPSQSTLHPAEEPPPSGPPYGHFEPGGSPNPHQPSIIVRHSANPPYSNIPSDEERPPNTSTSEFSGLVSYFSSQQDDLNT